MRATALEAPRDPAPCARLLWRRRVTRLLYLDCVGGAAGDMLLAALLDAGADPDSVRSGLAGLGVDGLEVRTERVARHGIAATRVRVVGAEAQPHRDWASIRDQI